LPPSPRRLAEARRAGRIPWSPVLVAGFALGASALAVTAIGTTFAHRAGAALIAGASSSRAPDPVADAVSMSASGIVVSITRLAAPFLLLVAALALAGHLAQTRSIWIPRRGGRRLPPPADSAARRANLFTFGFARTFTVLAVCTSLLISTASTLAAHTGLTATATGTLATALLGVLLAHVAATVIVLGVLDWLARSRMHQADLAMTAREARDERREQEPDPRWRRRFAAASAEDDAIRHALVVITDDRTAIALAWHARYQPIPRIATIGRDRAAARLIALARRYGVAIHRDVVLASNLAALSAGAVPNRLHADIARVIVAVDR
jgi:flagellar biosynthesis protein FlhB